MTVSDRDASIVLYELAPVALDDPAADEMLAGYRADPEKRWYAQRRMTALRAAAKWNPLLHPRGPDGQFIDKFGLVRWLEHGFWRRGMVTGIDPDTGKITVQYRTEGGIESAPTKQVTFPDASNLYALPKPRATLNLPNVHEEGDDKWEKTGGQGGSNPGGRFKAKMDLYSLIEFTDDEIKQAAPPATITKVSGAGRPTWGFVNFSVTGLPDHRMTAVVNGDSLETLDGKPLAMSWEFVSGNDPVWFHAPPSYLAIARVNLAKRSVQPVTEGDQFYVKVGKTPDHSRNEVLANTLYQMAGVAVPDMAMSGSGSKVASKFVSGTISPIGEWLGDDEVMKQVRENFVIDAWLANWDAAGLGLENMVVTETPAGLGVSLPPQVWRLDTGGALQYRAQGTPKGDAFGPVVGELQTMLSSDQGKKVYAGITADEIAAGVQRLAAVTPWAIRGAVEQAGVDDSVADTLIARRKNILEYYGVEPAGVPLSWVDPTGEVIFSDAALVEAEKADLPDVSPLPEPPPTPTAVATTPEMETQDIPTAFAPVPDPPLEKPVYAVNGITQDISIVDEFVWGDMKKAMNDWVAGGSHGPHPLEQYVGRSFIWGGDETGTAAMSPNIVTLEGVNLNPSHHTNQWSALFREPSGGLTHLHATTASWASYTDSLSFYELTAPVVVTPAATFKKNGDIVVRGTVVGKWEDNYWYPKYKVTIFAQHSLTGAQVTYSSSYRTQTRRWVTARTTAAVVHPQVAPPPKPKKEKAKATSLEKTVKAAAPSQATAGVAPPTLEKPAPDEAPVPEPTPPPSPSGDPLTLDGKEYKKGMWVQSVKTGFKGQLTEWYAKKKAGVIVVNPDTGDKKYMKITDLKSLDDKGAPSVKEVSDSPPEWTDALGNPYEVGSKVYIMGAQDPITSGKSGVVTGIDPVTGIISVQFGDGTSLPQKADDGKITDPAHPVTDLPPEVAAPILSDAPTEPIPDVTPSPPESDAPKLMPQAQEVKDQWAMDGRKLTKDGYALEIGLPVVDNKGNKWIVASIPGKYSSNPSSITVYPATATENYPKARSRVSNMLTIDHEAAIPKGVASISGLTTIAGSGVGAPLVLGAQPDGTRVYRRRVWKSIKSEQRRVWEYFYVNVNNKDSGQVVAFRNWAQSVGSKLYLEGAVHVAEPGKPAIELVAVFDSTSDKTLGIRTFNNAFQADDPYAVATVYNADEMSLAEAIAKATGTAPPPKEPEVPPAGTPVKAKVGEPVPAGAPTPAPEPKSIPAPEPTPEPEVTVLSETETPTGPELPEQVFDETDLSALPPPPKATPPVPYVGPEPPKVTGVLGNLDTVPAGLATTEIKSVMGAYKEMEELADSTDPGSGVRYATLDADAIEDMQVRTQVVKKKNGEQYMEVRFRLKEDPSEDLATKMMMQGEAQKGGWVKGDLVNVTDLVAGDVLSIRVATSNKQLKPTEGQANAVVVEPAVLIGTWTDGTTPLYQVKVANALGEVAEMQVQLRPEPSVQLMKYDPEYVNVTSGAPWSLTPAAVADGWAVQVQDAMTYEGVKHEIYTDATGAKTPLPSGGGVGTSASGGMSVIRTDPGDGSILRVNIAHPKSGGTGANSARRNSYAGNVFLRVPLDGRTDAQVQASISAGLERVGITPEQQAPPTPEALARMAINKVFTAYSNSYLYKKEPNATGLPGDPGTTAILTDITKTLGKIGEGRPMTLDDILIQTYPDGRMQVRVSDEVADAIAKKQGITFVEHRSTSTDDVAPLADFLSGVHSGLLATDERWSRGIFTNGMSSETDMNKGTGQYLYTSPGHGTLSQYKSSSSSYFVFPARFYNSTPETYVTHGDTHGVRDSNNQLLTASSLSGFQLMFKRMVYPEQIGYMYVNEQRRKEILKILHDRGVTHLGTRPVEDVIVGPEGPKFNVHDEEFKSLGWDYGIGVPITKLLAA